VCIDCVSATGHSSYSRHCCVIFCFHDRHRLRQRLQRVEVAPLLMIGYEEAKVSKFPLALWPRLSEKCSSDTVAQNLVLSPKDTQTKNCDAYPNHSPEKSQQGIIIHHSATMTNLLVRSRSPTTLKDNDELLQTKSDPVKEEIRQTKKENGPEDAASRSSTDGSTMDTTTTVSSRKASDRNPSHRTGRWTLDEKVLFLYGLQKFGKGRWKKMSVYLPNRYVNWSYYRKLTGITRYLLRSSTWAMMLSSTSLFF
jgi:hypothetical protein